MAVLLALGAAVGISGCGKRGRPAPDDDNDRPYSDFQGSWCSQGAQRVFTESDDDYYFIAYTGGAPYLYTADKDAMEPRPLCDKKDCLHDGEPDFQERKRCDAYIDESVQYASVSFADGMLYLLSGQGNGSSFVQINVKTGQRTALYWLDRVSGVNTAVHRGYLYTVKSGEWRGGYSLSQIWRHSLEKKESELLGEIPTIHSTTNDLKAFGNSLYIRGINPEELNQEVYYQLNLDTGALEIRTVADGATTADLTLYREKLLWGAVPFADRDRWNDASMELYAAGLEEGRQNQTLGTAGYLPFAADGDYFYQWNAPMGEQPMLSGKALYIYDSQGEQADRLPIDGMNLLAVYVAPGDHVFLADIGFGEANTYYYFPKSEIGSGKITPRLFFKGSH